MPKFLVFAHERRSFVLEVRAANPDHALDIANEIPLGEPAWDHYGSDELRFDVETEDGENAYLLDWPEEDDNT